MNSTKHRSCMTSNCRALLNITSCLILLIGPKTWCHPQNWDGRDNIHKNFGEVQPYGFRVMWADRQTNRQRNRRTVMTIVGRALCGSQSNHMCHIRGIEGRRLADRRGDQVTSSIHKFYTATSGGHLRRPTLQHITLINLTPKHFPIVLGTKYILYSIYRVRQNKVAP